MKITRKLTFTFSLFGILFVSFVYLYLASSININLFYPTELSYFNFLIQAFSNQRLDLISPTVLDLSANQGKWYTYWGPTPIVFILPFYIVSGIYASDILYTLVAGILNVLIFYLVIKEFCKFFSLSLSPIKYHLTVLSFAFASPNLYLSLNGRVWHTSQIISIFYLLLFFLFYFKFLNNFIKLRFFILAVIFINLAWFSRYTLIFNLLLLLFPLGILYKRCFPQFKIALLITFLITTLTFSLMLIYNQARFADPFETGIRYASHNPRFVKDLETKGVFNPAYIKHNLTYYFLALPQLSPNTFKINFNYEGNSVFAVYPYLLFLFLLIRKKLRAYTEHKFFLLAIIVLFLNIGALMMFFGTGWVQFGNRYFFDVIPLLFLLTLFVIQKTRLFILVIFLLFGIFINLFGTSSFYT